LRRPCCGASFNLFILILFLSAGFFIIHFP
jgi:hypothetical protein